MSSKVRPLAPGNFNTLRAIIADTRVSYQPIDDRILPAGTRSLCMLSVYRGHYLSPEDIAKFEFALEHSAISTQMFDGYLLTIKCVSAHQSGWFTDSIENSKNAIEVFRKDGSAYGEYYIHLHLAMIGGLMDDSQLKERGFAKARELTRCELSYDDIARTPYQILSQECEHASNSPIRRETDDVDRFDWRPASENDPASTILLKRAIAPR